MREVRPCLNCIAREFGKGVEISEQTRFGDLCPACHTTLPLTGKCDNCEWQPMTTEHPDFTRMHDDLLDHGYQDIAEHRGLRVGMRVRHIGHQYPEAYANGTGTVLAVMYKNPSSWSQSYGRPDVELLVAMDSGSISNIADYHVALIKDPA
jgi:hypothetical protein